MQAVNNPVCWSGMAWWEVLHSILNEDIKDWLCFGILH
jgi:hypothetical protein